MEREEIKEMEERIKKEDLSEQEIESLREIKKAERVRKCLEEINNALTKYNCYLDVSAILSSPTPTNPTGVRFTINVLPREV